MEDLKGKIAIVTGAGIGIGRGIATVLANHGATVVCTDVRQPAASETAEVMFPVAGKRWPSLTT